MQFILLSTNVFSLRLRVVRISHNITNMLPKLVFFIGNKCKILDVLYYNKMNHCLNIQLKLIVFNEILMKYYHQKCTYMIPSPEGKLN